MFAPLPLDLKPELAAALAGRGIERLYSHQAEAYAAVRAGPAPGRRDADRQRQDALLQPAGPAAPARGPRAARHLPLPDQGARPGPAGGARRAQARPAHRPPRGHLRRRHPARAAHRHPRGRPHRHDQPRHAAHRRAAAPHALAAAVLEPRVRRHRRAAHVSRPLRQPGRQRDPAAEAHLRVLRLEPDVHLRLGDHRQPARARAAPARGGRHRAGRPQRRAARRAPPDLLQPAARQPRARHAPQLDARGAPHRGAVDSRRASRRSSSAAAACRSR